MFCLLAFGLVSTSTNLGTSGVITYPVSSIISLQTASSPVSSKSI